MQDGFTARRMKLALTNGANSGDHYGSVLNIQGKNEELASIAERNGRYKGEENSVTDGMVKPLLKTG